MIGALEPCPYCGVINDLIDRSVGTCRRCGAILEIAPGS